MYKERDENAREKFKALIESLNNTAKYYIDESGIDKFYEREYGYAKRGERAYGEVSGRKFKRTGLVSAYECVENKVVAPFEFDGTMNSDLFEGWFETVFLPCVEPKSIAIVDNAGFHNKYALYDLADEYDITLIFLPPYSPDLNPIEKLWANLKRHLRNYSRNFATVQEAISDFFQVR